MGYTWVIYGLYLACGLWLHGILLAQLQVQPPETQLHQLQQLHLRGRKGVVPGGLEYEERSP